MSDTASPPSLGSYVLPHMKHATVADAMHPGIFSCARETTLTEVARLMSTHHVHCILMDGAPDGESDGSRWAIISDLDLIRAGMRPDAPDTAGDLPLQPAVTVATTGALRDAAELMLAKQTSHVVAVNPETRRPVGILSTLDIAGVLAWGEV